VIVAVVSEATATVVTVNVVLVEPAGIVAVAGTVAELELLLSEIGSPPVGAAVPIVTVPVELLPPKTLVGDKVSAVTVGGLIVNVAVADLPLAVAVIVAAALVDTGTVVTVKVALVAPAATVTEAGTVALALLLDRLTASPPVGAALEIVTVPVEDAPPITVVGANASAEAVGAVIVRVAVWEVAFAVAVIVAVVLAATAFVVTVKVADVAPDATVTEAGTVAAALLLVRLTT